MTLNNLLNNSIITIAETKSAEPNLGLGIQYYQIVFYIICFLVAMVVLNKFLFKPLGRILDKRHAKVEATLQENDDLVAKLAGINAEALKITDAAKAEGRTIVEKAREEAQPEYDKVLAQANADKETILEAAQSEAQKTINSAKSEAETQAMGIVSKVLKKSVSNLSVSQKLQEDLTNEILNKI